MSEILNGTIARINYYNQDSGYTIALFELDYKKKDVLAAKNKIIGNNITVVGFFDRAVYEGEEYELEGDYVKDKNYGLQFKFTKFGQLANPEEAVTLLSTRFQLLKFIV